MKSIQELVNECEMIIKKGKGTVLNGAYGFRKECYFAEEKMMQKICS